MGILVPASYLSGFLRHSQYQTSFYLYDQGLLLTLLIGDLVP